jgi:hypothetical protein
VSLFADGTVKGTPLNHGPFTFTVLAFSEFGFNEKAYTITIAQGSSNSPLQVAAVNTLTTWVQSDQIHVKGLEVNQPWTVYSMTGAIVYQAMASSEEAEIRLPNRGTYIIVSDNRSVKVVY